MPGLLEDHDGMAEADRLAMGAPRGTPLGFFRESAWGSPPDGRSEVFPTVSTTTPTPSTTLALNRVRVAHADELVNPFAAASHRISVPYEPASRPVPDGRLCRETTPPVALFANAVSVFLEAADVRNAAGGVRLHCESLVHALPQD